MSTAARGGKEPVDEAIVDEAIMEKRVEVSTAVLDGRPGGIVIEGVRESGQRHESKKRLRHLLTERETIPVWQSLLRTAELAG